MPDNKLNRVVKWDNMKFLLIFCVVIGHISEMYTGNYIWFKRLFLFIYVFHMPAFLFVSGLFSKKTVKERRFKTIFSYLILYFVIKILRNGIHYVVYGKGSFSILIFSWAISCRIHALSMLVFSGLPVKAKESETSKNQ